jgi:hypothetical protein
MKINTLNWFNEELGNPGEVAGGQPPADATGGNQVVMQNNNPEVQPEQAPDATPQETETELPKQDSQQDISQQEPQSPDVPEEQSEAEDFETWKMSYFKDLVKGDTSLLLGNIHKIRDFDLDAYPRKFVEDNLQILFLRQNSNIEKAGKEIRKSIRQELDNNNPSVSLVNHMFTSLQSCPDLTNVFIKLKGTLGMKSDLHRKYLASLLGAAQVGSGGNSEDIIYNERTYSIKASTRFNEKWGMIDLGKWSLREDDPERFLEEPELKRLEEGSPEERDVLRRRVIMEAIADNFKQRSFVVNVVGTDGTVYFLGLDLGSCLSTAYADGKLSVRTIQSENSEAMIDDDGNVVPYVDLKIKYLYDTGEVDENGFPKKGESDFMERIDGILFVTAQLDTLKQAASSFPGVIIKELPFNGNPSDLKVIQRCVPSAAEIILRNC